MAALTHLVVLDFEATCDDVDPPRPQEIIELPSVLLSTADWSVVDEFESFVRPVHHPKLTAFCTELTSIEQAQVDGAPIFADVLEAHLAWLRSHGLPTEGELPYALVTCGDWDLQTMLPAQLAAMDPPMRWVPAPYRRWINVKVPFRRWTPKKVPAGMVRMLEALGIELEGRHHRGIDDSRNIAKIVRALVGHGQAMEITSELRANRYPPVSIVLERDGERVELVLEKRAMKTLLGAAHGAFRHRATAIAHGERRLTEDADLCDLRDGDVLLVR
ncbi:MAG: exonuclease domain-containing protein [Sandaracinaceae bacterium]|nr:exonuclease domain-containing protein [Sandaracinaceae bacterium]